MNDKGKADRRPAVHKAPTPIPLPQRPGDGTLTAECWGGPWDGRREPIAVALGALVWVLHVDPHCWASGSGFYYLTDDGMTYRWTERHGLRT